MPLYKPFLLIAGLFVVACSNSEDVIVTEAVSISDPFAMMQQLRQSTDPFVLFGQAYPTFRFTTQATFYETDRNDQTLPPLVAKTTYEAIDNQYFHIQRVPFEPVPSVELIFDRGLHFLRPHLQETFYQIKNNPEVDRLKHTITEEVFHFFDLTTLAQEQPIQEQNNLCYHGGQGFICFDQQTLLPITGNVTHKLEQSSQAPSGFESFMTIEFHLDIDAKDILPIQPEEAHSLRNHG